MVDNHNLIFLQQAANGCISGDVADWPQIITASAWAINKIESLNHIAYLADKVRIAYETKYCKKGYYCRTKPLDYAIYDLSIALANLTMDEENESENETDEDE